MNDMPMIRCAGMGVAMENGEQALKDAADVVTLSNEEDGVACVVRELLR
jgi:hydroxymethylpyrimidine pyrophosphatase-like HAD family hydrolase